MPLERPRHPLRRPGRHLGSAARAARGPGVAGPSDRRQRPAARFSRAVRRPRVSSSWTRPRRCLWAATDPRTHRLRHSRGRRIPHLRPRTARRDLRRQRRGQEHSDRHDGAQHQRRSHRAGAGGRTRPRSAPLPRRGSGRRRRKRVGGGGFHLRPVAAVAHPRRAGGHRGGGIFLRPGKKCSAGGRLAYPSGHGAAGNRTGRRRTAHRQGLHAFGLHACWLA